MTMSPEARDRCLRIHADADRFLLRALLRIRLLGVRKQRRSILAEYVAGRLGGWK